MLIKLLKYEFKFAGRTLLPIYAALLVLTVLFNLGGGMESAGRFAASGTHFYDFLMTMVIFAYSCVMSAVCIITVVLLVQRFYKNLLRDEGYLMHTLPVSPWQNIAAKLICAVIWSVISLFMAILSICLISMDWEAWQNFFEGWKYLVHDLNVAFGFHWVLFLIEVILAGFFMLASSIVKVYLALAVGHIANNHKIACSVAAYIGLEVLSALIAQLLGRAIVGWEWLVNLINEIFNGYVSHQIAGVHMVMLATLAFWFIYTAIMFIGTNWIMKHKLNLE